MTRLVVFDVDSTLLALESLDFAVELALKEAGDGDDRARELADITARGMAGELDFRRSLEARIALARLTRDQVNAASKALRGQATPGIEDLLEKLRARGRDVYAVSGGFSDLVEPALMDLGFSPGEIRANRFVYDDDVVTGFDTANPLSRNGGKAHVVSTLKTLTGREVAIMVGDGITDYEAFANGAADAFIGFGGVVARDAVRSRAPVFADTVTELARQLLG